MKTLFLSFSRGGVGKQWFCRLEPNPQPPSFSVLHLTKLIQGGVERSNLWCIFWAGLLISCQFSFNPHQILNTLFISDVTFPLLDPHILQKERGLLMILSAPLYLIYEGPAAGAWGVRCIPWGFGASNQVLLDLYFLFILAMSGAREATSSQHLCVCVGGGGGRGDPCSQMCGAGALPLEQSCCFFTSTHGKWCMIYCFS